MHGNVSLPASLVTKGVLGDPDIVLIPIRLFSIHGHHLGIVVTFIKGLELTLTGPALRRALALAHTATADAATADQLHARTVLRPYGLQGLPGDVDRGSEGGYIKSTEIRHISLSVASRTICLIPYRRSPVT